MLCYERLVDFPMAIGRGGDSKACGVSAALIFQKVGTSTCVRVGQALF